jgi:deoxyadenosine/deoxycytidine kinase
MKIGIIGPIASGKSTLGLILSTHYSLPLIEETVQDNVFLPLFYQHKSIFGVFSQTSFYSSLFYNMYQAKDSKGFIVDTTVYSNLVFSHLMFDEGILSLDELNTVKTLGQKHFDVLGDLDLYIVIKRTKEALFNNCLSRNRTIEQDQEKYLDYHYNHYYEKLETVFNQFRINRKKIYYMNHLDLKNKTDFNTLIYDLSHYMEDKQ